MSIHDYISFNSNEEYERSIFQFVQMAGEMTIKDAKQQLDQVIDRVFSKNRLLTYKCGGRTGRAIPCTRLTPASGSRTGRSGSSPIR